MDFWKKKIIVLFYNEIYLHVLFIISESVFYSLSREFIKDNLVMDKNQPNIKGPNFM